MFLLPCNANFEKVTVQLIKTQTYADEEINLFSLVVDYSLVKISGLILHQPLENKNRPFELQASVQVPLPVCARLRPHYHHPEGRLFVATSLHISSQSQFIASHRVLDF
ncbi:hypothetical protein RRG08_033110 [Elysia crispata]|uniref:Uncharacterized protein n=1 Tax=Elysia crispata TaxID=231223 RepID=A0AAE1ECH2_9GAST|nr:hypothetical protein RRG08_033110 [Elysia crispata]